MHRYLGRGAILVATASCYLGMYIFHKSVYKVRAAESQDDYVHVPQMPSHRVYSDWLA